MPPDVGLTGCLTLADLAGLLEIDEARLRNFAYERAPYINYKKRAFRQKTGKHRTLAIPHSTLKMIQHRLAKELDKLYRPSSRAFGYIKGRGIRRNAEHHLGNRTVFSIDLVNFFGQINFGRVRGRLMAKPYGLTDAVATTIAKLTTHENQLPFGAPTSPVLSNMICSGLDADLSCLGRDAGSFYTRYADDIVFSTQRNSFPHTIARLIQKEGARDVMPGSELERIISEHGFQINPDKTRFRSRKDSQIICGVLINEKLNVRPKLRREIRAMLHAWQKFGPEKVQEFWTVKYGNPEGRNFEPSLRGKIEFLRHIRGENDPVVWSTVQRFNALTTKQSIPYAMPKKKWSTQISRSVCVIDVDAASHGVYRQGTGFVMNGGLILTNAHVACHEDGSGVEGITLRFEAFKKLRFDAEVIASDKSLDVALLRFKAPEETNGLHFPELELDFNANHERGSSITLAGYPNYQDGDTIHVVNGEITGASTINGLGVFRISVNVIYGNSGGPVFNEQGRVIGIAVCGSDVKDAPYNIHNGAIPCSAIQAFIEQLQPVILQSLARISK